MNNILYNNLLIRVKDNDIQAYNQLYNLFFIPLCLFAERYINDKEIVKDCVQEVFFSIWKNRHSLTVEVSARSYLYTATRNKCLNILEKKKYELTYEQYILNTYIPYTSDDLYSMEELTSIIEKALTKLPDKLREVFMMSRFENMTYKEIAMCKNISVKTVEAYIHKSLIILTSQLKDYLYIFLILLFL